MKHILLLFGSVLVFATQGVSALEPNGSLILQRSAAAAPRITSHITVTVPHDQAELIIEGRTIPGTGTSREFETPLLNRDTLYRYQFTATWKPNGYTTITRRRTVAFLGGAPVAVDLTVEDPTDRVRVVYVPTPPDIVDEMVKLAGIRAGDVVYEPGCGDARITIAAVNGGASRGVGIDIDPALVDESRTRVKEAGLENKIEIRLGDALDIQDLSTATVVFLYMGDHFNLLIRPILWKQLKVGARVVSHRFTMGDWKPDKTVSITSDFGGEYELHLWTVTEELKRKMASLQP